MTTRNRSNRGALIDRGANGSVGGSDVRVIAYVEGYKVDVGGLDGHRINDIPIATVDAVMQDQTGEFIAIINQVAYYRKGRTILSSPQIESFGLQVHDRALRAGGCHCIQSPDGYFMPLKIIDNLAYTPIRAYSDKEWETLPHRHITSDTWTSNNRDFVMTDVDNWASTVSTNNVNPDSRPFDQHGKYKHRHVSMTDVSEIPHDEFFDSIQPCQNTNLHDIHCTVDALATSHTFEAQFHDNLRYLDTLVETIEHPDLFAVHT